MPQSRITECFIAAIMNRDRQPMIKIKLRVVNEIAPIVDNSTGGLPARGREQSELRGKVSNRNRHLAS
jgi:hypothetical protein